MVVVPPTEITAVTGGGAKAGKWNLFVIDSGGTSPAGTADDYTKVAAFKVVSVASSNSGCPYVLDVTNGGA